jgi:hypothetical protein
MLERDFQPMEGMLAGFLHSSSCRAEHEAAEKGLHGSFALWTLRALPVQCDISAFQVLHLLMHPQEQA